MPIRTHSLSNGQEVALQFDGDGRLVGAWLTWYDGAGDALCCQQVRKDTGIPMESFLEACRLMMPPQGSLF